MENDPAEARNLIDEPSLAAAVQEMRKKLMDFRIQTKGPVARAVVSGGGAGRRAFVNRSPLLGGAFSSR